MKPHGIRSLFANLSGSAAEGRIRRPAVAGAFYPQDPVALRTMVDGYLDEAAAAGGPAGSVLGLIAPHAGFTSIPAAWRRTLMPLCVARGLSA
jgi:hypothetical protein